MKIDRRSFLSGLAGTAVLSAFCNRTLFGSVPEAALAADPQRPQFHLLPARNWMNDPNGPIYYNGRYHMFFQYNPLAAVWGDMSWYHSVSEDMVHWTHLPVALMPTPDSPDSFGCFSGSAIRVGRRVYQVYTGTKQGPKELATIHDGQDTIQESQCLAYSDDPMLVTWTKQKQPILARPPAGLAITGFRDPSAWKDGDWYYMTVGSGIAEKGGCVLLYRSRDMEKGWEYLHPLISGAWNGRKTANPCDDGEMWECPDFFALDGGHVLIYSTLGKVFWQSGDFDTDTLTFHPGKTGELDLGAFYAPKTQLDTQGRRILWGWIQERRSEDAMKAAGWSGMMSLPRVLNLDKDGTLRITMLPQLDILRGGMIPAHASGSLTLAKASGEVLCAGKAGQPMNLTFSDGTADGLLRIGYAPATHTMTVDGRQFALAAEDEPKLHAFVDASVLEVIVSERIGYTKRFYGNGPTAPDVTVTVAGDGVTMKAWRMKPISNNRLTTPGA